MLSFHGTLTLDIWYQTRVPGALGSDGSWDSGVGIPEPVLGELPCRTFDQGPRLLRRC